MFLHLSFSGDPRNPESSCISEFPLMRGLCNSYLNAGASLFQHTIRNLCSQSEDTKSNLSVITMKFSGILVLLAVLVAAVCASPFRPRPSLPRPRPGNPGFPNFPGQGPFNPGRFRRSPGGSVTVDQPVGGRANVNVDVHEKVWEGEHGKITVYGQGNMESGGRPQTRAGVRGEFHWGDD